MKMSIQIPNFPKQNEHWIGTSVNMYRESWMILWNLVHSLQLQSICTFYVLCFFLFLIENEKLRMPTFQICN